MPWLHLGFCDNPIVKYSTAKVTLIPIKTKVDPIVSSGVNMWLVCVLNVAWYDTAAKIVVIIYFSLLMLKFDLREFASLVIITFRKFLDFKRSRAIFFKNAINFVKRSTVYPGFFRDALIFALLHSLICCKIFNIQKVYPVLSARRIFLNCKND